MIANTFFGALDNPCYFRLRIIPVPYWVGQGKLLDNLYCLRLTIILALLTIFDKENSYDCKYWFCCFREQHLKQIWHTKLRPKIVLKGQRSI